LESQELWKKSQGRRNKLNRMIKIETIQDIDEGDTNFSNQLSIFVEAENNWDESIDYVEQYIVRIREYLGGTLNLNRFEILDIVKTKNLMTDAWKVESIHVLLKLLDDQPLSLKMSSALDELIANLRNYLDMNS
jgi:hypothetical protein